MTVVGLGFRRGPGAFVQGVVPASAGSSDESPHGEIRCHAGDLFGGVLAAAVGVEDHGAVGPGAGSRNATARRRPDSTTWGAGWRRTQWATRALSPLRHRRSARIEGGEPHDSRIEEAPVGPRPAKVKARYLGPYLDRRWVIA